MRAPICNVQVFVSVEGAKQLLLYNRRDARLTNDCIVQIMVTLLRQVRVLGNETSALLHVSKTLCITLFNSCMSSVYFLPSCNKATHTLVDFHLVLIQLTYR